MNLVLGIDAQPTKLGLALVRLEDAVPVWANTLSCRGPGRTFGGHIRANIRKADVEAERVRGEVTVVGIERAVVHYAPLDILYDMGGSYHLAYDACLLRWKDRAVAYDSMRVTEWKAEATGNGQMKKDQVAVWSRDLCRRCGWADWQMVGLREMDATDAVAIAVAAAQRAVR